MAGKIKMDEACVRASGEKGFSQPISREESAEAGGAAWAIGSDDSFAGNREPALECLDQLLKAANLHLAGGGLVKVADEADGDAVGGDGSGGFLIGPSRIDADFDLAIALASDQEVVAGGS